MTLPHLPHSARPAWTVTLTRCLSARWLASYPRCLGVPRLASYSALWSLQYLPSAALGQDGLPQIRLALGIVLVYHQAECVFPPVDDERTEAVVSV